MPRFSSPSKALSPSENPSRNLAFHPHDSAKTRKMKPSHSRRRRRGIPCGQAVRGLSTGKGVSRPRRRVKFDARSSRSDPTTLPGSLVERFMRGRCLREALLWTLHWLSPVTTTSAPDSARFGWGTGDTQRLARDSASGIGYPSAPTSRCSQKPVVKPEVRTRTRERVAHLHP